MMHEIEDDESTMLAAYCHGHDDADNPLAAHYELRTIARPSLRKPIGDGESSPVYNYPPGTLLIRTVAASICGSDLFGTGGCASSPGWRRPTDLLVAMQERCGGSGHESIGEIVDIVPHEHASKAASKQLRVGQKVLAMSTSYMYKVVKLRKIFEEETGCKLEEVFPEETGAFCEYFISHSCVCLPLPETVPRDGFDHRWYVMAQPLGTVLHACRKLGSVIGLDIAVVGQGQNGLILAQILSNMGARRIITLDLLEERLVYSKRNGATHTIHVGSPMNSEALRGRVEQITEGKMCHIAVDMVGHQSKTITLCSDLTRDAGRVLLFGLPPAKDEEPMGIRYVDLSRNLIYICSHSPEMDTFRRALELLEQGRFDPSTIFSHNVPFGEFVDAYDKACQYEDGVVKLLLTFTE